MTEASRPIKRHSAPNIQALRAEECKDEGLASEALPADPIAMNYTIFNTAGGWCGLAWTDAGIARFQLPAHDRDVAHGSWLRRISDAVQAEPVSEAAAAVSAVDRYFAGDVVDFRPFTLDLSGTEAFSRGIYEALREVGWGTTTTYGDLAKSAGHGTGASQVVGVAMARNPIPLFIPCHRVLAAGGKPGGFTAPGGVTSKLKMLELEGAKPSGSTSNQHAFDF